MSGAATGGDQPNKFWDSLQQTFLCGQPGGDSAGSAVSGGSLIPIGRQVLAAPASVITFANIPQTYENLVLSILGRVDDVAANESVVAIFNSDTGTNYQWQGAYGHGTTAGGYQAEAQAHLSLGDIAAGSATALYASSITVRIPGYARTTFFKSTQSVVALPVSAAAGASYVESQGGLWLSTAAISQIDLKDSGGGNFVAGTVVSLYGES